MSLRCTLALALALGATLSTRTARADEETRPLADDVDFSRPPQQVEGYNKARITCETEVRPEGRTFRVHGRAYYPDGVMFVITLRYWKHTQPFVRARATVRDRTFSADLGPFAKALPGGEVVAEAWFVLAQQTPEVKKRLADEKYFSCTPPCRWDQRSATRASVALGGAAAQATDEGLEKDQLRRAVDAVLAAFRVEEAVCLEARQGKATPEEVEAALSRLDADLGAAAAQLAAWRDGRAVLLFPGRLGEVDALGSAAATAGQLHAVIGGVKLEGVEGGQVAFEQLARALADLRERGDALRGFLAEEGSLDREWQRLNDAAKTRWAESQQEAPAGTTDRPAAGPGGR